MYKIFLLFYLLFIPSLLFGSDNLITDPFSKSKKINFCLNDISNYPIGIFQSKVLSSTYEVDFNTNLNIISISKSGFSDTNALPYISNIDDYFDKLYTINQIYNLNKVFKYPDSIVNNKNSNNKYVEIVDFDIRGIGKASLKVQGNINIQGKLVNQDQELVRSSFREREQTNFKFDQKQQLNVQGKIGDQVTISLDQNSERDFDWENTIRVDYQGNDDDILKKLEAGNISLSLPGTEFVTFSGQNEGLFGVKAIAQLGPVNITNIASLERTKKQSQKYKGSSQVEEKSIQDYEYKKNLYFFIHQWFRNGSTDIIPGDGFQLNIPPYYPLNNGLHNIGNLVVRNFELYKIDVSNNPAADPGIAYIDPNDTSYYNDSSKEGAFIRLERGTHYEINEDLGFIRMKNSLDNEIIAAHFDLADRSTGNIVLTIGSDIGEDDNNILLLKMIKPQSSHPNHPTWDLMFKNVYSLGGRNIDASTLNVRIVDKFSTPISDRSDEGNTFLNLFGLDNRNQAGELIPDENIDLNNPNIVDIKSGEIHLPSLLPFVSEDNILGGNINASLDPFLQLGKMYTTTNRSEYIGDSRFTVEANYSSPQSSINLGFTLVEGSEEIYYNGTKLQKGADYQIDYFSGTIVMSDNIDPDGDLEILYDKHDLVTFDKKIMIGSRAQIDFDDNSFLGVTALYYNQDIANKKVEVGFEPIRNFIWDINGRYEKDLEDLSSSLNEYNIFNSEKLSRFNIEGEIAQVLPNPNSISNSATGDKNGVAYIDDFEGSKRITSPSILRRFWHKSSAPIDIENNNQEFSQRNRLKMYWYNPFSQILTNDIWPNVSTSVRAQNLTTDILVLNFEPYEYQSISNPDSLWAGITAPMFVGDYDQTRTKFVEIWLRGDSGNLTIDLGKISEDSDGNMVLNNEDIPDAGLALGNGFLEDNEDTGLDGCFDIFEDGWGNCLDSTGLNYQEYLSSGETVLINSSADIDPNDPNGDNWNYTEGSTDYRFVNGTENNGTGDRIQPGGKYPDSEDLDKSGFLDRTNDYFTKTVSLSDPTYIAGSTEIDGIQTGWKLVRIPISHFTKVQDITLSEVRYVRLMVSGVSEASKLEIARIELVGNTWESMGTSFVQENQYTVQDSTFLVTVVNDQDNPDYIPPKGVYGEYDEINQIRSKEQSLVLKFNNMNSSTKGAAKKILSFQGDKQGQSFLIYDMMKMYVYGNSIDIAENETDVRLFIEFGNGEEYYRLIQPIYEGWDEDRNRNSINLDLDWLTKLKNSDDSSVEKINANDSFIYSDNYRSYSFLDENNEEYKKIEIIGNPSLSRLQYFIVGVENNSNHPISGELWLDELRLSGVKKEKGTAVRLKSEFNLSDFTKSTFSYTRKDADFHILQERLGTNRNSESFIFSNQIQLGKLFRKDFGILFPINMSYNMQNSTPKFYPGTDIRTSSSVPDSVATKSSTVRVSGRLSKQIKSENPFIRYTVDNLSTNFNISQQKRSDEIMKSVDISQLSTGVDYNLQFPSDNYVEAFKWLEKIPVVGENMSKTKFFYTPTSFVAGIQMNQNLTERNSRSTQDIIDDFVLGLNRNFVINYKAFDNLQFNYTNNIQSDMSEYRDKVIDAIIDFETGERTNNNESFSSNFSPKWFPRFSPNFVYNANYSWSKPKSTVFDGANITSVRNTAINFNLSFTEMFELFYNPSSVKKKTESKTQTRSRENPRSLSVNERGKDSDKEESGDKDSKADNQNFTKQSNKKRNNNLFLDQAYEWSKKIDPLSFTINNTTNLSSNGIQGSVPLKYRFGFSDSHGLEYAPEVGLNTGIDDVKKSLSIRGGIRFNPSTSINISFSENISSNLNGYGVDIRSISRDYFSYGDHMSNGFPFSNWTLRIGGLEKIKFINPYVSSFSIEHAFNGKQNMSWRFDDNGISSISLLRISSFIDKNSDSIKFSRTIRNFTPLIGFTTTFKNGISTNIRTNIMHTLNEVTNGLTYTSEKSILASMTYNFTKGIRIPLPLTERNIDLKNNINLTFNFDVSRKKEEGSKDKINFAEQNFVNSWKAVLRVTYTLTDNVSGSLFYEYRENDTRLTGRRIDRDFGVNINVAIRG